MSLNRDLKQRTARNIKLSFGQQSISEYITQHKFQKFRDGNKSLEDEESRRYPSAIVNNDLRTIIEDPHKTIREMAEELNC